MKRAKYSIKNLIKKGLATLLSVCLIVSGVQTPVYAAEASIPTESTATVSGLVNKKVVLDLLSDDLREAALTAIRENRLFEAGDYLGATSDSAKAIKEYEAFFNRNPGLYVVEVPDSVKNILSGEAESELRIFVQKDEKKSKVDLEEENGDDESVLTRDVNFRYGTEDDIILYEPSSQIDTLVNGGEDAYYRDPEQDTADNSDYQLTGKEKITFMFVNASDDSVRYTLKVDGVKYDSVEICGRTAALKHVLAEAGIKKTEETTAAAVETTAAQAANTLTEIPQTGENLIPEGMADPSEMIGQMELTDNEIDNTAMENPVTDEQDAENNNEGYIAADTDTSQQQLTEENTAELTNNDAAELTNNDTAELTNNDTAELTNDNAAELTDNDTAGINDQQEANVENVDEAPAQNEDSEGASIVDQIAEAVENAGDLVLGRMTVYAAEIIGEGYIFEDEQKGPETEDREKSEDIAAEAGDTEGNDNEAAEKQNVEADLADNSGTDEGQNNGQEYGQQGGQEIGQQDDGLGTEALAGQNEGSGTEIVGQNEAGSGNESNVTIVDIFTEDNQQEGVQNDNTSTEISTGDVPETAIEGTIPEGQDLTGMMAEPETTAAAEIQKPETTVKMPVASPSEVEETKGEYDEFAKGLIEEVKQAVLEDKDAAKEQIKVAKIVQYSIGSLGKIHYLTEIDGYSVEIFASQDAFGGFKPTLEVKRLYKPEEAEGNGDVPTDAEIAELKANGIYDNSLLLDISFKNDIGEEVEPNGNVNVRITLNDEELLKKIDASSLEVHHIKDNNSTLTTEKVAEKEEVKILDGNDVQISDSDLEANAEAIAAGGEAEVEVASAVAEFEVESFSTFVFTWKEGGNQVKINLIYKSRDKNGNISDITFAEKLSSTIHLEEEWNKIKISEILGVPTYTFKEARLGSLTSTEKYTEISAENKKSYISLYNGNTEKRITDKSIDLYLIYEPEEYSTGGQGGSSTTVTTAGTFTPKKSVVPNGDGTYKITLSVTGDAGTTTVKSKVNVLVILDNSNSMYKNDNKVKIDEFWVESTANDAAWGIDSEGNHPQLYHNETYGKWYLDSDKTKEYKGVRYKRELNKSWTRMDVAQEAIKVLANSLLANNADASDHTVDMAYMYYSKSASSIKGPTNDASVFKPYMNGLSKEEHGTNWEEALKVAHEYKWNDNDPVYIIFVSDGLPSVRNSAMSHWEQKTSGTHWAAPYFFADGDPNSDNFKAAQIYADSIIHSGKEIFSVNAFGEANTMTGLVKDSGHYFDASDPSKLSKAFTDIGNKIQSDLFYDVIINDGITNLTSTMEVIGVAGDYEYNVIPKEGVTATTEQINNAKNAIKDTASYVKKTEADGSTKTSVVWNLGKDGYKLEDGWTYTVSFSVWPKQEAYDLLADANNGLMSENELKANGFVKDEATGKWVYLTNTKVTYSYKTTGGAEVNDQEADAKDCPPGKMEITGTGIKIEKLWKIDKDDFDNQKILIEDEDSIILGLYKEHNENDPVKFVENGEETSEIVVEPRVETDKVSVYDGEKLLGTEDQEGLRWTNGRTINIAPGILLSVTAANKKRFEDSEGHHPGIVTFTNKNNVTESYYVLENGHSYNFLEKSHSDSFDLDERDYHPMLIDGQLWEVEFNDDVVYGDDGKIVSGTIKNKVSMGSPETITAVNELSYEDLKVTKLFIGNMATVGSTITFKVHLFDKDGNAKDHDYYDYILKKNSSINLKKAKNEAGEYERNVYEFSITPTELYDVNSENSFVTLKLPANAQYTIEETTKGYTAKWGTKFENNKVTDLSSGAITDKFKLKGTGAVNTIYFVNEKKNITPTGIADNAYPFVALALAGFAAMFFLACDFEKKRLFED